jgi:hypothetical protein
VNHHLTDADEFDANVDDVAMDEIEYEESCGVDTAVEVELFVARMQATRFWAV